MENESKYPYIKYDKEILNCEYNFTDKFNYDFKNKQFKRYRVSLKNCENFPFDKSDNLQIKELIVGYEPKKDVKKIPLVKSEYFSDKMTPFKKILKSKGIKEDKKKSYMVSLDNADIFCDYVNTDIDHFISENFREDSDEVDFVKGKRYRVKLKNCETISPVISDGLTNIIINNLILEYTPEKDKIKIDALDKNEEKNVLKTRKNTIENMLKETKSKYEIKSFKYQLNQVNEAIKNIENQEKMKKNNI